MGMISAVGSFIKIIADRLRALLTITQVLTRSTGEANNSSRSSNNIQPPVEDPVAAPVDPLAAGGFSAGTIARRTTSPELVSRSRDDMVSMLRSFTDDGNGVRQTALSDRMFMNSCFTLPSRLVGDMIQGSAGSVREHREIRDIELRLPYSDQDLRGGASSSRTTNTGSTLVGDSGRHNQDPNIKEFRNFAYWITPLFIAILVSLLSANKRKPELLLRSCGSLVTGGFICCIAMLMLTLIRPSSQRALTCVKMMQYLNVGLLFVATVLVFTLL